MEQISAQVTKDLTEKLSEFIYYTHYEQLPEKAIENAKLCILEMLGSIMIGNQTDYIKNAILNLGVNDPPEVSIIGHKDLKKSVGIAALINASAGTVKEYIGGHRFSYGMPGIATIPTALAMGEKLGSSGKEIIEAVVLGFDVHARIGLGSNPMRYSFHPHGTLAIYGSAVAAAKLLKFTKSELINLLNLVSVMPIFSHRRTTFEGATIRNIYPGMSAFNGILATSLVKSGITGPSNGIISCFGDISTEKFIEEKVTEELGERYEITRNYYKLHPCDRHLHGALDALELLIKRLGTEKLNKVNIEKIIVYTYFRAFKCSTKSPHNSLSAQWSIPHALAARIVLGSSGFEAFSDEAVWNAEVRELAQKIDIFEDPKFTLEEPGTRKTKIEVILKDSSSYTEKVNIPRGEFDNPCTIKELEDKFYKMASKIIHEQNLVFSILNFVKELEKVSTINEITKII